MRRRLGLITLAVTAAMAVPAQAADYNGTLGPDSPAFTWESTGNGVSDPVGLGLPGCGDAHNCDNVVLKLTSPGDLKVDLVNPGGVHLEDPTGTLGGLGSLQDVDMYIYKANDAGEPQGDPLTEDGASTAPSETATVTGLQAGTYLVRVEYFLALGASYTGTATLSNFPAAAPQPAAPSNPPAPPAQSPPPAAAPPPASQPAPAESEAPKKKTKKKSSKKACVKKAKKIKNKRKRKKAIKRCSAKKKKR